MTTNAPVKFLELPTGKCHISFSEFRDWTDCSWRHKVKHVLKVDLSKPGPMLDFGTAVHASGENYLKTKIMDPSIATNMLKQMWDEKKGIKGFEESALTQFLIEAEAILTEIPDWFDKTFPNWEFIDAEHYLYEQIGILPHAMKGYIDGVIRCDGPRGKKVIWLIDWKTTSWGWGIEKKSDPLVRAQLIIYKNFWSIKTGTDPKNVKCGFVLLKRTAKTGNRCELVSISVGDVTTNRSLKVINNMIVTIKRGIAIKNRNNCIYCDYKNTEHCT